MGGLFEDEDGMTFEYLSEEEAEYLYEEVFVRRSYFQHGVELVDGAVIVDCGANLGLFSLQCLREAERVQVIAFEPIPAMYELLVRNLYNNAATRVDSGLCPRPIPLRVGVGAEEGSSSFTFFPECPGESTRHPDEREGQQRLLRGDAAANGWRSMLGLPFSPAGDSNQCTGQPTSAGAARRQTARAAGEAAIPGADTGASMAAAVELAQAPSPLPSTPAGAAQTDAVRPRDRVVPRATGGVEGTAPALRADGAAHGDPGDRCACAVDGSGLCMERGALAAASPSQADVVPGEVASAGTGVVPTAAAAAGGLGAPRAALVQRREEEEVCPVVPLSRALEGASAGTGVPTAAAAAGGGGGGDLGAPHAALAQRQQDEEVCPVVPLSLALEELGVSRVDLLKIDVEGDELAVLEGVSHWPAVRQVVAEVHDVDGRLGKVVDLLRGRAGFGPHEVHVEAQKTSQVRGFIMVVPEALRMFYVYAKRAPGRLIRAEVAACQVESGK